MDVHAVRQRQLDRRAAAARPAPPSAISSISSCLTSHSRRASGTTRGSAVNTAGTSVKISHSSAPEGGRDGDRRGVRSAPAQRGHVAVGRDALEAGDQHDRAVAPARRGCAAARCRPAGRCRARRRWRCRPAARSATRPVNRARPRPSRPARRRSTRRPRAGRRARAAAAGRSSRTPSPRGRRSTCPSPRAPRPRGPVRCAATIRSATARSRSWSATEVPPNFHTSGGGVRVTPGCLHLVLPAHQAGCVARAACSESTQSANRSMPCPRSSSGVVSGRSSLITSSRGPARSMIRPPYVGLLGHRSGRRGSAQRTPIIMPRPLT